MEVQRVFEPAQLYKGMRIGTRLERTLINSAVPALRNNNTEDLVRYLKQDVVPLKRAELALKFYVGRYGFGNLCEIELGVSIPLVIDIHSTESKRNETVELINKIRGVEDRTLEIPPAKTNSSLSRTEDSLSKALIISAAQHSLFIGDRAKLEILHFLGMEDAIDVDTTNILYGVDIRTIAEEDVNLNALLAHLSNIWLTEPAEAELKSAYLQIAFRSRKIQLRNYLPAETERQQRIINDYIMYRRDGSLLISLHLKDGKYLGKSGKPVKNVTLYPPETRIEDIFGSPAIADKTSRYLVCDIEEIMAIDILNRNAFFTGRFNIK